MYVSSTAVSLCSDLVCVCVCVRERERGGWRGREGGRDGDSLENQTTPFYSTACITNTQMGGGGVERERESKNADSTFHCANGPY